MKTIVKLSAVALLLTLPAVVHAQFNYTTDNGTITITGYTGPGGAVVIPGTINGLPVTRIGELAFYGKTSLTSITIPNSVGNIGRSAFNHCTSLTSVTIPSSVTSIGGYAFDSCSLTNVTIGNGVTSIGDGAFYFCTSLTSVTIPNSVTSIGIGAFFSCRSLTNVTIPNSVTNIGDYPFASCTSLSAITVDAFNSVYRSVDGVLFDKRQTLLIQCPGGKAGSYTIPDRVTSTGSYAFLSCISLTSVTIPNGVTSIGFAAFTSCSSLTSVTIPNSVTTIGDFAFKYCTSLTSVTIGNSVTNIGNAAFASCTSLSAITVDALNSVYSTVDCVLFNKNQTVLIQCPGGKAGSYTIPNSVTSIGIGAFSGCASLTSVTIPNTVPSIENAAFYSCTSLTSVTIPNSVTSIGTGAFSGCASLTSVTIPNSVTFIRDEAFVGCTSLTTIYFQGYPPCIAHIDASGQFFCDDDGVLGAGTVYYRTTGWGTTFGGRPAVLWNPVVQTNHASFGVRTNRFGFNITGTADIPIVVEATTNLANASWVPLQSLNLTNGAFYFTDPDWTNFPARTYRIRSP